MSPNLVNISVDALPTYPAHPTVDHVYHLHYEVSHIDIAQQSYNWLQVLCDRILHDLAQFLSEYGETLDWKTLQREQSMDPLRMMFRVDFTVAGYSDLAAPPVKRQPQPPVKEKLSWDGWPLGDPNES